jgi:hypothetical protein
MKPVFLGYFVLRMQFCLIFVRLEISQLLFNLYHERNHRASGFHQGGDLEPFL